MGLELTKFGVLGEFPFQNEKFKTLRSHKPPQRTHGRSRDLVCFLFFAVGMVRVSEKQMNVENIESPDRRLTILSRGSVFKVSHVNESVGVDKHLQSSNLLCSDLVIC